MQGYEGRHNFRERRKVEDRRTRVFEVGVQRGGRERPERALRRVDRCLWRTHLEVEPNAQKKWWRSSGRTERKKGHEGRETKERTIREITKVRSLVWVLALLVLVGFVAGCGSASDQARQEDAKKKAENKAQQVQKQAKQKVEAKKQELKKKVDDLETQVNDLQKDVTELQKKINAHEQKEQDQQINQLKKALKELQKKVETQEQQGQKLK
jgi:valyl-tRNA synthetase